MSETSAHVHARCEECNHAFRIPHADRTYKCKTCGGVVRAVDEPADASSVLIEGTVTCTECNAVNPGGLHFCNECGASLEPSDPLPGSDAHIRLRKQAAGALKRAHAWINGLAIMYRIGAVAYIVATVFAVLALARPDVPREAGLLVVALTTLLSVMLLMGALHILFKPFVWTCAIAVVATVISIVHFVGVDPLGVASLASAVWAVLAWAALVPTFKFRQLIAHHKDLYIIQHSSAQTRRSLRDRSAHERHERLLSRMRRAARRTWMLSTAIATCLIILSAVGASLTLSKLRPTELSPSVASFEAAWNEADLASVSALFDPGVREVEATRLNALLVGHGWRSSPPPLARGRTEEADGRVTIAYDVADITVSTSWRQAGTSWNLVEVALPVPAVAPVVERFIEAWEGSDPAAISEFFAPDARAEMRERITASRSGRGWDDFPEVIEIEYEPGTKWNATAILKLDRGEVRTDWHFGMEGAWRLYGLKLPKR